MNSHISKSCHFAAAKRQKNINNFLSFIIILINVILGSVFFTLLSTQLSDITKWVGAGLSLVAAFGTGTINFFNFSKKFERHRSVANRYLKFGLECEWLINKYLDKLITLKALSLKLDEIHQIYNEINVDAEVLPTTDADYRKAKKRETRRQKRFALRLGLDQEQSCN